MSAGSPPLSQSDAGIWPGYVALFWRPETPDLPWVQLRRAIACHAAALDLIIDQPGFLLFADRSDPRWRPTIDRSGTLVVLGSIFDKSGNWP